MKVSPPCSWAMSDRPATLRWCGTCTVLLQLTCCQHVGYQMIFLYEHVVQP